MTTWINKHINPIKLFRGKRQQEVQWLLCVYDSPPILRFSPDSDPPAVCCAASDCTGTLYRHEPVQPQCHQGRLNEERLKPGECIHWDLYTTKNSFLTFLWSVLSYVWLHYIIIKRYLSVQYLRPNIFYYVIWHQFTTCMWQLIITKEWVECLMFASFRGAASRWILLPSSPCFQSCYAKLS